MKMIWLVISLLIIWSLVVRAVDVNISSCGTLSTANSYNRLNQSVNSTGTCFSISANNVTLDCQGYTINYSSNGNIGFGINISKYNVSTIKNCTVQDGNSSTTNPNNFAFYLNYANNISIINNTIHTIGDSANGIELLYSDYNNISDNTIITSNQYSVGIYLSSGSESNNIYNSIIRTNKRNADGIVILSSSHNNNISNNNLIINDSYGIYVQNSNYIRIEYNNVTSNLSSIYLQTIANSTISSNNASSVSDYGIYLSFSNDNLFVNNTAKYSGSSLQSLYITYSNNNNFTSTSMESTGGGIWLSHSYNNRFSVTNISIPSTKTSVYLRNSTGNMLDCLNFSGFYHIYVDNSVNGTNFNFTNCSYRKDGSFETVTGGGNSILRRWYYRGYARQDNGTPLNNIYITAYNISNILAFNISTDATGYTPLQEIVEYVNTGGTRSYYNNYTIYANVTTLNHTYNVSVQLNNLADTFIFSNYLPTVKTNISFTNFTARHSFNLTATFSDLDGATDIISSSIKATSGTCLYISNTTSGNDITFKYNCTGTALAVTTIDLNVTDLSSASVNSTAINTYPNQLPSVASATLTPTSPTDDDYLICNNGTTSDIDGDIVTLIYNWQNGTTWMGINNFNLSPANTSVNDIWRCSITPNDGYQNSTVIYSASVSIATSYVSPTLNYTNATAINTGVNSSSLTPTNNNTQVNLSITFNDGNSGELHTAYFCKSTGITTSGCSGETYCNSSINSSNYPMLYCTYNISNLSSSSYTYYAYVIDDSSLMSTHLEGTFNVNHFPSTPTIVEPIAVLTRNWTIINFTSSDIDSDTINYTIYNSTNNITWSQLYSGNDVYNWTNLFDGSYYLKAYSTDQHGYSNYINSTETNFTIDWHGPTLNLFYASATSVYTTSSVIFYGNITDSITGTSSSACKFTLRKSDYNGGNGVGNPYNETTNTKDGDLHYFSLSMAALGAGTLEWQNAYCYDTVSNLNSNSSIGINISISVYTAPSPGGGGTVTYVAPPEIPELEEQPKLAGFCGDGICDASIGEEPLSCYKDCVPQIFNIEDIFCTPMFDCGNWKRSWFVNGVMIFIPLGLISLKFIPKKS